MRVPGKALAVAGVMIAALAPGATAAAKTAPPGRFVSLHDVVPSIVIEMRYFTAHNFIGRPIRGYRQPLCIVTNETAAALSRVQARVRRHGYTLKVYDCYRPQRAVDDFVAWGKRVRDQRMKREFYPYEPKSRVFKDGYIATKSGHSRGSTVDLTLVRRPPGPQDHYRRGQRLVPCTAPPSRRFRDNSIDMGTGYDCFDRRAHPFSTRVSARAHRNRMRLRRAMLREGFMPLATEWWHFTLRDEPFADRYFDFPVSRRSLRSNG
jgi:zinc D-Ala-D-Ala dipeptidase